MSEERESQSYIGRCKCGSLVAAIVINSSQRDPAAWRRYVAKTVAELVRDGLEVEKVETQLVRDTLAFCTCPSEVARRDAKRTKQVDLFAGKLAEAGA